MPRFTTTPTRYPGIFKRDDDGRYLVRVTATDRRTGRRRDRSRTLPQGATMTDARAALTALEAETRGGDRPKVPTVRAYSEIWSLRKARRGDWKPNTNTAHVNVGILANHVWPEIGDIRVDQLTAADVAAWMDRQMSSGAAPSSVRQRWRTLRPMLRAACSEYQLPDVTEATSPPRVASRGGADLVLMPAEVAKLLEYVRINEPQYLALMVLGFASGARISELVAVQVRDLDLSGRVGRWKVQRHAGARAKIVEGTKTGAGRVCYLDPTSTARLRELVAGRFPAEWLTPSRYPGRCVTRRGVHGLFSERLGPAMGRRLSSKVFRQTYVTLARMAGLSAIHSQDQVGHTSEAMQAVYMRAPEELREQSAERFDGVLWGGGKE